MRFNFALVFLLATSFVYGGDTLFQPSVRPARAGEIIYFLLADRFNDGDPSNNRGGIASESPEETGFDPSNPHFFHGGDLPGITAKLDYLRDLGVSSIWMTPIFRNRAVQKYGEGVPSKAGYHGYWILDFTEVDPHFGTKGDLQ